MQSAIALTAVDFGLALFVLPAFSPAAALCASCLLPLLLLMAAVPSRLLIGDDGVQWRNCLRSKRGTFVSYSDLLRIEDSARGVTLILRDGREIPCYPIGAPELKLYAIRSELRRRYGEWRELGSVDLSPHLEAHDENRPYRSSHDADSLMALVAARNAAPETRMLAAQKLAPIADDRTRAAFRSLSAANVEPSVRALFAMIGKGRD